MDDIDIRLKLDEVYSYQLGEGRGCSLQKALDHVGLPKSTHKLFDEKLRMEVKAEVAARILKQRTDAELAVTEAKAQQEVEIARKEIEVRERAADLAVKILNRMEQVIDTGSDFNAKAAAEIVINIARNGLQPDRGNRIVFTNGQPETPALAPLPPARPAQYLPLPQDLQPAEALEVTTQAKYSDGTLIQQKVTRPDVVEQ